MIRDKILKGLQYFCITLWFWIKFQLNYEYMKKICDLLNIIKNREMKK